MRRVRDVPVRLFVMWLGDNAMSDDRRLAFKSMSENIKVPLEFITKQNLHEWILPNDPLPMCFSKMSLNHQSDFLRAYFLHYYGGGYADIKHYSPDNNFSEMFDRINRDRNIEIIGERESPRWGLGVVPPVKVPDVLLACGWFIIRPFSTVSYELYRRIRLVVLQNSLSVMENPATETHGGKGYPIEYFSVFGRVFHPLMKEVSLKCPHVVCRDLHPGVLRKPYR